jgi:(R,R)-butanediol dehydrogenase/meso-butanediol dehydrogenase/diacetyl reductase
MKAAYYEGQRSLRVGECVPRPPAAGEVQIEVAFCGVCGTDLHVFEGHMDARVPRSHVMGHEMSGTIVDIGSEVAQWQSGQRVVVRPIDSCGTCPACVRGHGHICQKLNFIGIDSPGAFQSLWTVPAHTLHLLPAELSFEQAALIEPLAVACHDIRLSGLQPGEEVVVIGAGPIGTIVSLVARNAGANVLVSEVNPFRVQFARDLGFEVVNPKEQDLVTTVEERTGGGGADVVFEVSGSQAGASVMTKLLRTRGRAVIVAIFAEAPTIDLLQVFLRELQLYGVRVYEHEDFERATKLAQQGSLPLDTLITEHRGLEALQGVFEEMESGGDIMKVLIDTQR